MLCDVKQIKPQQKKKGVWMMKLKLVKFLAKLGAFKLLLGGTGTALLLSGCGGIPVRDNKDYMATIMAVKPDPGRVIQEELRNARTKLDDCYTGSQSEMTLVSGFQLALAQMELEHIRYTIWNQSNYGKIEAAFLKDEETWERRLKAEMEKPSEFEGGSIAPMDNNQRMTALIVDRIAELKEKWCEKNR